MKNLIVLATILILISSCAKQEDTINLPPEDSMSMDFSSFTDTKSASLSETDTTTVNYRYAKGNVAFWNTVVYINLAVPVASFKTAFKHVPVKIAEKTWEWSYTVEGFATAYTARLTGSILTDSVEWKMYITKSGIGAFDEFLWFSGKSASDRSGGYWILNHSNTYQEKTLQIDWSYENEEVGDIKYTVIRELNDSRTEEKNFGAFIHYGHSGDYYNAYYDIHVYNIFTQSFADVNIEWSRTNFDGRVKSENKFDDEEWHCWDSNGYDQDCN